MTDKEKWMNIMSRWAEENGTIYRVDEYRIILPDFAVEDDSHGVRHRLALVYDFDKNGKLEDISLVDEINLG